MATVDTTDRVVILASQRKEARNLFGESNVPRLDGVKGQNEPRLVPDYAKTLLTYWIDDTARVRDGMTFLQLVDVTAIARPYLDNQGVMENLRGQLTGLFVGDALMQKIWSSVSRAAITGFAVDTTPKPWTLAVEAVKEAVAELPSTLLNLPIIGDVIKIAAVALAAVLLIEVTK